MVKVFRNVHISLDSLGSLLSPIPKIIADLSGLMWLFCAFQSEISSEMCAFNAFQVEMRISLKSTFEL